MSKAPFPLVPGLNINSFLYCFNYVGNKNDRGLDKVAFDAALDTYFPLTASPVIQNYGLGMIGPDLTITDAGGTIRIIQVTSGQTLPTNTGKYVIVYYKGQLVPDSDIGSVSLGGPNHIVMIVGTVAKYPSVDANDYLVYFFGGIPSIITEFDGGGIDLPIDSNEINSIGIKEPVISTFTRGDSESTGSFKAIVNLSAIIFDGGSVKNEPGEDIYRAIYGSEWTVNGGFNSRSNLATPSNPFGLMLLTLTGKDTSNDSGEVWAIANFVYHCEITQIGGLEGVSSDSTDPVLMTVDYTTKYEPDKAVIRIV